MSPSQRCDEVLRLIDETLSDHPTPSVEGVDSGANRPPLMPARHRRCP